MSKSFTQNVLGFEENALDSWWALVTHRDQKKTNMGRGTSNSNTSVVDAHSATRLYEKFPSVLNKNMEFKKANDQIRSEYSLAQPCQYSSWLYHSTAQLKI